MHDAIQRGDLRIISSYEQTSDARLGLVLQVNPIFVEMALVHPYYELATSKDAVISSALCGTSYDIVIQNDLRGVVWISQVGQLIGHLSDNHLETISDVLESIQPQSEDIRIGIPLMGEHDRRWSFKASEGKALDSFTTDCSTQLLEMM
jgi:hypothetical protein